MVQPVRGVSSKGKVRDTTLHHCVTSCTRPPTPDVELYLSLLCVSCPSPAAAPTAAPPVAVTTSYPPMGSVHASSGVGPFPPMGLMGRGFLPFSFSPAPGGLQQVNLWRWCQVTSLSISAYSSPGISQLTYARVVSLSRSPLCRSDPASCPTPGPRHYHPCSPCSRRLSTSQGHTPSPPSLRSRPAPHACQLLQQAAAPPAALPTGRPAASDTRAGLARRYGRPLR